MIGVDLYRNNKINVVYDEICLVVMQRYLLFEQYITYSTIQHFKNRRNKLLNFFFLVLKENFSFSQHHHTT